MKNQIFIVLFLMQHFFTAAQVSPAAGLSAETKDRLLQKASALRVVEDYSGAVQQLDTILQYQPADAPILLYKGDLLLQGKRFAEAAATYRQLLPLGYESTTAHINLSYALFMAHHPAQALAYARKAWEGDKRSANAVVNYFNALLWNIKTKEAAQFLAAHDSLLSAAQQLVLKARLFTTSGNYNRGLACYDSLVTAYPDKYYAQEYAEVLLGKKEITTSAGVMRKHSGLFSANESRAFARKVAAAQLQNAGTELGYFKDVAGNTRLESMAWWQQCDGVKYRVRVAGGASNITAAQGEKTSMAFANLTIAERWSRAWSGETQLQVQRVQPNGGTAFTGITGKQAVQYQPNDRRMFGAFYQTEILNFTAELLGKNIRSHSAGYLTHLMLSGTTGFYSQGSAAVLTDNNRRFQFFGSLYRLLRTEPTVKTGINFSALHFANSSIKTYFSPNRYLSGEAFADFSTALPRLSRFYFQAQAAAGMQKIESGDWEPALRLQTELGVRFKHLETSLKYQTSNVAAANGTGYQFDWLTMKLLWRW